MHNKAVAHAAGRATSHVFECAGSDRPFGAQTPSRRLRNIPTKAAPHAIQARQMVIWGIGCNIVSPVALSNMIVATVNIPRGNTSDQYCGS